RGESDTIEPSLDQVEQPFLRGKGDEAVEAVGSEMNLHKVRLVVQERGEWALGSPLEIETHRFVSVAQEHRHPPACELDERIEERQVEEVPNLAGALAGAVKVEAHHVVTARCERSGQTHRKTVPSDRQAVDPADEQDRCDAVRRGRGPCPNTEDMFPARWEEGFLPIQRCSRR